VWISEDELRGWNAPANGKRKPGGQQSYSNRAIETALTVGRGFHLALRQTEGFLRSIFTLLDLNCRAPDCDSSYAIQVCKEDADCANGETCHAFACGGVDTDNFALGLALGLCTETAPMFCE
jgi:hypothetical protein